MAGLDFSEGDGKALFIEGLAQAGLAAVGEEAWQQWLANPNKGEFLFWLRGTQAYKTEYPMAEEMRRKGLPFSEAGVISYRQNVRQLLHSVGAPPEFATKEYIDGLIANNIGFNEIEQRVAGGLQDYFNAPADVKAEFQSQLGDDAAIVAFYLDADHTIQQFQQIKAGALVRGYGKRFGFDINFDQAAQFGAGMSAEEVQQRLGQAQQFEPLTRGTLGQGGIDDSALVQDVFTGTNKRINREVEERAAAFSDQGGGYSSGAQTGFGVARGA